MDKKLFGNFLSFLKHAGKVATQSADTLEEYTERLDNFLDYSRSLDREPIKAIDEVERVLIANGNYVEAAEALFNESKIYLREGKMAEYFGFFHRGISVLFSAVFIPDIYMELLGMLKESKNTIFYPFLYSEKAYAEHVHLHDYEKALNDYILVKSLISSVDKELFPTMGYRDYTVFDWRFSLNMVDVLFKLSMYNRDEAEYYFAMADRTLTELYEKYGNSENVRIFIELFWIQFYITKGDSERAKSLMEEVIETYGKKKWFSSYKAIVSFLRTLYYWSLGDYKATITHIKKAIQDAINTGDEIMTKETIDFAIFLLESSGKEFSIYSREGEEILNTILGILFTKDWYLGIDHSTKVAELSLKVANEYSRITGVNIDGEKVYMAGLLHDIGKLYVPWFVLNKPSRLDEMEWLCIKYHPVYGKEIMERIGLGEYARYVEEHHERNDGSGYPYGKRNLPPLSQIIGVADIFEAATTTNRLYKSPKTELEILQELRAMKGIKFDRKVIEALEGAFGESVEKAVL